MNQSVAPIAKTLYIIQRQSSPYIFSAFLIFGVTGCSFNILLFLCRRKFRTVTCCIYMATASIIMLINISFNMGTALYFLNPKHAAIPTAVFSRINAYISQSTSMMYRWCLVAASFDRYALSSTDLCLRNFAKMSIARRTIAAIVIVWTILPVHNLIYNTVSFNLAHANYNTFLLYYHSFFTVITGCILPASFMIICALLTYHNLVLKQQRRQVIISRPRGANRTAKEQERKRDRQVLLLLLVQVIVFVITIIPSLISHFYHAVTINIKNRSIERGLLERFAGFLASLTMNLFPTLSFYLYTMTSSLFRKEFKNSVRFVLRCHCCRPSARVEPLRNTNRNRTITKY